MAYTANKMCRRNGRESMKRNDVKQGILLITYAAGLILLLIYCKDIFRGIAALIDLCRSFFIGIVIAFILNQPYEWIYLRLRKSCRAKSARKIAVLLTYLGVIGMVSGVIWIIIPQLIHSVHLFAVNAGYYLENLQMQANLLAERLHIRAVDLEAVVQAVRSGLGELGGVTGTVVGTVVTATGTMVSFVVSLFIAIAFSVYLLAGKKRILSQIRRLAVTFLPELLYQKLRYFFEVVTISFRNYIIGQSIEAVILGSLCFAGMWLLRLDYAGIVSVVIGITAMIPILGAYLGGVIAVLLLLMVAPIKAGIFLLFFIILQQIENNVIYPRVVGGRIGLPGIWVLFAITVGGKLGGIAGIFLGVPAMTVVYTLLKNSVCSREHQNLREL